MINSTRTKETEKNFTLLSPSNQFKIIESIDEQNTMFHVKRYSDSKSFFVKTEKVLRDKKIISRRLKEFADLKNFLKRSKINYILLPEETFLCEDPDSPSYLELWKVFENLEHVLWNQYYTGGFRLRKKYVVRHFNETEMLLLSEALISSLVLLFSKGKIPSFHNFFVCLADQQYKLYFDAFDDIKENPVMSFVDFDKQAQRICIKKIIHKHSRMPPPALIAFDKKEFKARKSRRQQMRSLKQDKLRKKKTQLELRVKSLKRDVEEPEEKKYSDPEAIIFKVQVNEERVKEPQPKEYVQRVLKRYNYVKHRLDRNLFSSFLVTRFNGMLDYATVLIYGFLKDVVFAFYDIRVQSPDSLHELYQQDKLDHFKNLLEMFFFMFKKKAFGSSTSSQNLEQNASPKNGSFPNRKNSNKTANTEANSNLLASLRNVSSNSVNHTRAKRDYLFEKLDFFFRTCNRAISEFMNREMEFPNMHWHYLQYPVFRHLQKLSLIFCESLVDDSLIFSDLTSRLKNLQSLNSLNLGFSG
jgi:hypothetical protein